MSVAKITKFSCSDGSVHATELDAYKREAEYWQKRYIDLQDAREQSFAPKTISFGIDDRDGEDIPF